MTWEDILYKFGFFWSIKRLWYLMDHRTKKPKEIKSYLNNNIFIADVFKTEKVFPDFNDKNHDFIMSNIYKWIEDNIEYVSDDVNFDTRECWEDIDVVIENQSADCESMSTLLFAIARTYKINPLKIKFCGGIVNFGLGRIGHSWVEYQRDLDMDWYVYDPAGIVNGWMMVKSKEYKRIYKSKWFEITDITFY